MDIVVNETALDWFYELPLVFSNNPTIEHLEPFWTTPFPLIFNAVDSGDYEIAFNLYASSPDTIFRLSRYANCYDGYVDTADPADDICGTTVRELCLNQCAYHRGVPIEALI